ncbi:MAG: phosphodiester glycosidase family protein [Bacteroidales bacterium]|nr:phosphodiester glycosidase family protein [Bacteroidales bacterium]
MKKIIITSLLILLAFVSCAQNDIDRKRVSDSLLVVNARWQVDSMDGFVLKRMHFKKKECLGSNQNICVIEVPADSPRKLAFTYEPQRTPTTVHASRNGALAAINGSFFDMGKHNPICYLRIDGVELGVNTPQASDSVHRKYYQYGTVILRNGRPYFVVPDSARLAERSWSDSNIMTAGPMLIRNGKLLPMRDDKTFVTYRHNRTAIGEKADGTVLLVTLDGRMKESQGMSLQDFQRLLRYLGCRDALNLDGGGSTTMYVKGMPHDGIVNRPTDNGKFDFKGERGVSNCVIIK